MIQEELLQALITLHETGVDCGTSIYRVGHPLKKEIAASVKSITSVMKLVGFKITRPVRSKVLTRLMGEDYK